MYGGSHLLFKSELPRRGIKVSLIESNDIKNFVEAINEKTKLVWLEVCSNPLVKVIDLKAMVKAIKKVNAKIVIGVDNTFLTPFILVRSTQ